MNKNSEFDDKDLIHEHTTPDALGEIYSDMVTPDIEEMNDHAATLEAESETEPDQL